MRFLKEKGDLPLFLYDHILCVPFRQKCLLAHWPRRTTRGGPPLPYFENQNEVPK